jgi:hypothetical protein
MSIINGLSLFFAPDAQVASGKLENWKSALSRKADETSGQVEERFSSLQQRTDQSSLNLEQFNQLRYEFKALSVGTLNYLREVNEPALAFSFQPVASIDAGKLKQNIHILKNGVLKKLSKKLEALKAEIRNCRNVEELKVLINKVKTFRDGIKIILTEQIIIPPTLKPTPIPTSSPITIVKVNTPPPVSIKTSPQGTTITTRSGIYTIGQVSEGKRFTGQKVAEKKVETAKAPQAGGLLSSDPNEKIMALLNYFNVNFGQIINRKLKVTTVSNYNLMVQVDIVIKVSARGKATLQKVSNKNIQLNENAKKEKTFFNRVAGQSIKEISQEIKNYKYKEYGLEKTFKGKPFTVSLAYSISN